MSPIDYLIKYYDISEERAEILVKANPTLTGPGIADKAGLELREDDPTPEEYGVEKDE